MSAAPERADDRPIVRASAEPYYLQLAGRIREQISAGTIAAGERLPSEGDLARRWALSRATVREALRLLEEEGWVTRIARRGAFASDPGQRGWMLQGRAGFFEHEVEGRRPQLVTHVLRAEVAPLPESAARALGQPVSDHGFVLERLRELDGQVALLAVNYLPAVVGTVVAHSDVVSGQGSLNATLRRAGYAVSGASRTVEAVAAEGLLAERLQVAAGSPVLRVVSTTWDAHHTTFDHHEVWIRSDVVRLEVQVGSVQADLVGDVGLGLLESPRV